MLVQDLVFLVIIVLGEGLIDEYGAGRSGRPFADKEILYRERGNEPVIPGSKARLFGHGDGGRGGEKVEVGSRFVMYLRGTLADEPLASRERRTNRLPFRNDYTFAWSRHHRADSSDSDSTREEHTAHVTIMHRINQFKMSKSAIRVTKE